MIIQEKRNWFRMLFIWQGSVVKQLLPRLGLLLLFSAGVVYFHGQLLHYKITLNASPFTLVGVALAIFLAFYNNAAYDRYWEARKLWGALLNDTRSLCRQAFTLTHYRADDKEPVHFTHLLIAFTFALKHQLRKTNPLPDMERLLPQPLATLVSEARFTPMMLLQEMGRWLQEAKQIGMTDSITLTAFDTNLNGLSNIAGGCERIAGTPIPFTYQLLLHRTVYVYCFLLPFGLVDSIGWMTPVMTIFIAYTFMALDSIITEIEEPFGTAPNDLALNAMSQTIELTLREMAGQKISTVPLQQGQVFID